MVVQSVIVWSQSGILHAYHVFNNIFFFHLTLFNFILGNSLARTPRIDGKEFFRQAR